MGFWHTGYMEFHEPVGFGTLSVADPPPPVYICDACGRQFSSPQDLRTHRFESHPLTRPSLFVRGIEVGGTTIRISRPLQDLDIEISNTLRASVNDIAVRPDDLASVLSALRRGATKVSLASDGQEVDFHILFDIPCETDLAGVEQSFQVVAHRGHLDRRAIEDFIEASRAFPSAMTYCDGICQYLYGVLAKERNPDTSLSFAAYREKFNNAADILKDFTTPLALLIQSLVAFHFNQFNRARALAPNCRVGAAGGRFGYWLGEIRDDLPALKHNTLSDVDGLLSDWDTERIIRWALSDSQHLIQNVAELESMVIADIAELDKVKLRMVLAEHYLKCGFLNQARLHARELRNSPAFESWALEFLRKTT